MEVDLLLVPYDFAQRGQQMRLAGADAIITCHAQDVARWLGEAR